MLEGPFVCTQFAGGGRRGLYIVLWSSLEEGCPFIFIFQLLPFDQVGSTEGEGQGNISSLGNTGPTGSLEASASTRSKQLCIRGDRNREAALRPLWGSG